MTPRSILTALSFAFLSLASFEGRALAAGDCGGGWVDGAGTSTNSIGCTAEDTGYSGSGFYGDCYGQCGYGCSWYNCGSGGACQDHDYKTRTYGLWSSAALSVFPSAIAQWGSCEINKGISSISTTIHSKSTGANGNQNKRVNN